MSFFRAIEPEFNRFVLGNAPVQQLATGFDWTEGPVWFGDANCLLFSDIPNDRIVRWMPDVGISTYRSPSDYANGHTRDRQGRLISCEHGSRRVTRTEHDGSVTVLADSFDGKRLNSPNDVVVKSDGSIWFTDPHYGIMTNYEGFAAEQELPCHVYRIDPATGTLESVLTDFECPNGLAFSPDEKRLYVAETGTMFNADAERHIRAFEVGDDGKLHGGDIFHVVNPGFADGIRGRHRRQCLVIGGRRRTLPQPAGCSARQNPDSGNGFQSLLWRPRQTSAIHYPPPPASIRFS